MKGATPTGPNVVMPSSAKPSRPTCTAVRCRENAACRRSTRNGGTNWEARVPAMVMTRSGVISGEPWPQPLKRRPMTEKACDMPVALKNTQPRQTYWQVEKRWTQSLQGPPDHEGPRRAVPETAQHHGDHDVADGLGLTVGAPTQRYVEVVAQPAGQRHVPTPPEVLQVACRVGRVEVLGEPEAEQHGEADGDVVVAAA